VIRLPIDNFVFKSFATKTIKLEIALKDLDSSFHVLVVEFQNHQSFGLIIELNTITHVFELTDTICFRGPKTLDLVTFRLEREQSKITLGKLSQPLVFFYKTLLKTEPKLVALKTNYFSFWRFAQGLKEEIAYGIGHVHNDSVTVWSLFESGDLTGGWLVKSQYEDPMSLSVDRVLEEAVRVNGLASFYQNDGRIAFEIKPTTIFEHNPNFPQLLNPDSKHRLLILKTWGEKGIDLATIFDGRHTLEELAKTHRQMDQVVVKMAEFLYENNMISRV
jgi:hypothetical protein